MDDALQLGLVSGRGRSEPDCDGGREGGFDDGGVKVYQHLFREVKLLQLPQEVHPLLDLLSDGADVLLPLEVLADDGSQEAEGLHRGHRGVTEDDRGEGGWGLPEVHCHLHCLQSIKLQVVSAAL